MYCCLNLAKGQVGGSLVALASQKIRRILHIHSKSEKIGGVYSSGKKNWRKKCVNGDDKNLQQDNVNHEIYDKMAYLIKNMILVCVCLRFKQLLNRVGRK